MNYVGRKDDGKYIPSKQTGTIKVNKYFSHPIAYNKDIADFAAEQRIKYRDAFLITINELKDDELVEAIASAKKRLI